MDPSIRLRIATRIHFALLRQYGERVGVSGLLKNEADAREALWVCEACGDAELMSLAREFKHASKTRPAAKAAPQDAAWARNTSGFGRSRPLDLGNAPSGFGPSNWLKPSTWLKGKGTRPAR